MAGKIEMVHALVRAIPAGTVASYGQIAGYVPGVTPRMVGHAMAGAPEDVPWHRVVNAKGAISPHAAAARQAVLLAEEGVVLDAMGRIDLARHRWPGPEPVALMEMGLDPEAAFLALAEAAGGAAPRR